MLCQHLPCSVAQGVVWSHSSATIVAVCCQLYRLDRRLSRLFTPITNRLGAIFVLGAESIEMDTDRDGGAIRATSRHWPSSA